MATWIPTTGITSKIRLDDLPIVDLDVHLLENVDEIAAYCDEPWRRVIAERQPVPPFGGGLRMFPNFPGQWEPRRPVSTSPATLRADLDALSIDLAVLFPEMCLALARQPDPHYAMAVARAYNRWIVDRYLTTERGFYGGIVAAPQDPEGTAREIARYAAHGRVVGIALPTSGVNPLWGDRRYDPIYEAAQEHDIAVMYHAGGSLLMPVLPYNLGQFDTWFSQHTYSHNVALMASLANLLSTGVPVRFPRLRMIFIEAGISWVLHMMHRLDWAWAQYRDDLSLLTEPPSAYIRRMFFATQPIEEPESLADMADVIRLIGGEESVLFASDYPHHDFDHPKKVYDVPVSPEVKRQIMGGNALRALNIPMPEAAQRVPRPVAVER
ncbi:MAG TPA: amidohydrolase family protein [Thermomicrobiales bacterium]